MNTQIIITMLLILLIYSLNTFIELRGLEYPLLSTLIELIILIFILIITLHKKEILQILKFKIDDKQTQIDSYFKKLNK